MVDFYFSDVAELTPLQAFYKNKSVFLTGGTGFLGKGEQLVSIHNYEKAIKKTTRNLFHHDL
jgi:hypothetical protein